MAEETYRLRQSRYESECAEHLARGERIGWARVGSALAAVAAGLAGWDGTLLSWPVGAALAVVLLAVFVALVIWHRRTQAAAARAGALAHINRQALARVRRQWHDLAPQTAPPEFEQTPLAKDLDLFGSASVYQLVCTAHTPLGRATLARWLLEPAPPETIACRQGAMRELAEQLDWRQEFEFHGRKQGREFADPAPFLAWAEGPRWLTGHTALTVYSCVGPALLWLAALGQSVGWTARPWWAALALVNLAVTMFVIKPIHAIFAQVSSGEQAFARYARLMDWIHHGRFTTPLLASWKQRLTADGHDAAAQLRTLQRRVTLTDLRTQMIYGVVQAATLWDIHALRSLESWQRRVGPRVRDWLAALADFEALASLAALAHAEPTWTDAVLYTEPTLTAQQLGHPLLPSTARVANDVELGPPGTFLLVTGSNMSGKSTLLRSIGVNVALAQAGGPVCAAMLRLPPLRLGASMRVQDSLEESTSYFMAELKRLKLIIDAAAAPGAVYLFLLDEILHGTNSRERRIAVQAVLERLLGERTVGAVSTHDLELADDGRLAAAAQTVHFRETIVETPAGRSMSFDYRMRPGVATTTNALVLLEMMGLAAKPKT